VSVDGGEGFSVFVFDNTFGYTLVLFRRGLVNNVFALFCFSLFGLYNLSVGLREGVYEAVGGRPKHEIVGTKEKSCDI